MQARTPHRGYLRPKEAGTFIKAVTAIVTMQHPITHQKKLT